MVSIKQSIKLEVLRQLVLKIEDISTAIISLTESRDANMKSSAGDKHETSRTKIQIEIDQLTKQLTHIQWQKNNLSNMDIN